MEIELEMEMKRKSDKVKSSECSGKRPNSFHSRSRGQHGQGHRASVARRTMKLVGVVIQADISAESLGN